MVVKRRVKSKRAKSYLVKRSEVRDEIIKGIERLETAKIALDEISKSLQEAIDNAARVSFDLAVTSEDQEDE